MATRQLLPGETLDPSVWLTDGYNPTLHATAQGKRASTKCRFDPSLATSPYTGEVQALEVCFVDGAHRQKGEVFMVHNLTLRPDDPFLPAAPVIEGNPPKLAAGHPPTLTTPFERDFVESIIAVPSPEMIPPVHPFSVRQG